VLKNWNAHFQRDPAKARFILAKSAAKQAGHIWEITLEQFRVLNALPCYYCAGPLPNKGRGLDRLDNSGDYLMSNVVPCCSICNMLRGDNFTPAETKVAIRAIQAYRKTQQETSTSWTN